MEVSKASPGNYSPLPLLLLCVHSPPIPTFWHTGFVSLLFIGCREVLGYYQHLFLFGLIKSILPYFHTFPIITCTPGTWRNLLCFPILGVTAGGRPLVPGLLACYITNGLGNFSHSSLCRWGHGHSTWWVSYRYTQLWSSQAFPHGPAGPTPSREGW